MGYVMILCRVTGKPVWTGIETDQFALDQAKRFMASLHCPACGSEHLWSRTDAWICEAPPRETSRAA